LPRDAASPQRRVAAVPGRYPEPVDGSSRLAVALWAEPKVRQDVRRSRQCPRERPAKWLDDPALRPLAQMQKAALRPEQFSLGRASPVRRARARR
jgi:hypothetical protein